MNQWLHFVKMTKLNRPGKGNTVWFWEPEQILVWTRSAGRWMRVGSSFLLGLFTLKDCDGGVHSPILSVQLSFQWALSAKWIINKTEPANIYTLCSRVHKLWHLMFCMLCCDGIWIQILFQSFIFVTVEFSFVMPDLQKLQKCGCHQLNSTLIYLLVYLTYWGKKKL